MDLIAPCRTILTQTFGLPLQVVSMLRGRDTRINHHPLLCYLGPGFSFNDNGPRRSLIATDMPLPPPAKGCRIANPLLFGILTQSHAQSIPYLHPFDNVC